MLIGVVGAPNKGKSTFFSAATMMDVQIANYPFTTLTPNMGVAYVRTPCPHAQLGLEKCDAKNSSCAGGTRLVPVKMIDIPGLVPDAHAGKGLGNRFLDSLREADALIQVVDATGTTDVCGNPCEESDPFNEIFFLLKELSYWLVEIMERNRRSATTEALANSLSGLGISHEAIVDAMEKCGLSPEAGAPDREGKERLALELVKKRFPMLVACNKVDLLGEEEVKALCRRADGLGIKVFPCSAALELGLRKAARLKLIDYMPGEGSFKIVGSPDKKQEEGLKTAIKLMERLGSSGVQQAIEYAVFDLLGMIAVYPVEDETKFANSKGEVLPDAHLVKRGTTAKELAARVHTDLAQKFIGAYDCKRKIQIAGSHPLHNGDVIKIIAGK